MIEAVLLLAIGAGLVLEGLFSGSEIALIAADVHVVRERAASGSRSAARALRLLENPEWYLPTCVVGTDICIVANTSFATALFLQALGPARGEWVSVAVMVPLILILGEILPKNVFRRRAEDRVAMLAPFILLASWVFFPLVYIVSGLARGILVAFAGSRGKRSLPYITKEGLKVLLTREAPESDVNRSEREMVNRVIDFSETTVDDVMIPISNVAALEEGSTFEEAARRIRETGFSRLPVYQDDLINIVGIVNAFSVLKELPGAAGRPVSSVVRQAPYVPSSKRAADLLIEMQRRGEPMCIVIDEYGGAVGIVTIEDILEEIVGDIRDEYDKRERSVRKLASGRYLVSARVGIDRLAELVPVKIPPGPYETLAGYLLHAMGRVPRRMEQYRSGAVQFVIEDADLKSIKQVQIVLPEGAPAARPEKG